MSGRTGPCSRDSSPRGRLGNERSTTRVVGPPRPPIGAGQSGDPVRRFRLQRESRRGSRYVFRWAVGASPTHSLGHRSPGDTDCKICIDFLERSHAGVEHHPKKKTHPHWLKVGAGREETGTGDKNHARGSPSSGPQRWQRHRGKNRETPHRQPPATRAME